MFIILQVKIFHIMLHFCFHSFEIGIKVFIQFWIKINFFTCLCIGGQVWLFMTLWINYRVGACCLRCIKTIWISFRINFSLIYISTFILKQKNCFLSFCSCYSWRKAQGKKSLEISKSLNSSNLPSIDNSGCKDSYHIL